MPFKSPLRVLDSTVIGCSAGDWRDRLDDTLRFNLPACRDLWAGLGDPFEVPVRGPGTMQLTLALKTLGQERC